MTDLNVGDTVFFNDRLTPHFVKGRSEDGDRVLIGVHSGSGPCYRVLYEPEGMISPLVQIGVVRAMRADGMSTTTAYRQIIREGIWSQGEVPEHSEPYVVTRVVPAPEHRRRPLWERPSTKGPA